MEGRTLEIYRKIRMYDASRNSKRNLNLVVFRRSFSLDNRKLTRCWHRTPDSHCNSNGCTICAVDPWMIRDREGD